MRLTRVGNVLTGYTSLDGVTWNQVSQATVSMGAIVNIGLLTSSVTPATSSKLDTGKLDSVTVTGDTSVAPSSYNALPAPTNVAVVPAATGTGMTLTWDEVPDATGYAIFRSSDGITFTQIATPAAGTLTYTDANPGATMRYFYRLATRDAVGSSVPSDSVSAVNRPPAPSNVSIINWNTSSLVVNWKDVSGDLGYRVERSGDAGATCSTLATVGTNVPAYTNSGLASGVTYSYRVITLSPAGDRAATAATGATRLAAVGGIAIDSSLSNAVAFHWSDIPLETGYRIKRSSNGTTWTTLTNVPTNQTTYTDTTVTPLQEYYYRVFGTAGAALSLTPTSYAFTATPATTALRPPWILRQHRLGSRAPAPPGTPAAPSPSSAAGATSTPPATTSASPPSPSSATA